MRSPLAIVLGASLACAPLSAQQPPLVVEHGLYSVHLLQRTIGTEEYDILEAGSHRQLSVTTHTADRGTPRTQNTTLDFFPNFTPTRLEQHVLSHDIDTASLTEISGTKVTAREAGTSRTFLKPAVAFAGVSDMPASVQMLMMRYWLHHQRPSRLPMLRASAAALPVEIRLVGHDVFTVRGEVVRLARYTVANLVFGREVLWMNDSERVAAVMTFAGGLPQEEVLDEYKFAFDPLFQSGVRQEMLDLAALTRSVRPLASGTFAIVGARLIDATGAPPVLNSVVLVRDGRIAAVGPAASVRIPPGTRTVHAEGQSILPGLWETHMHYSGVEFGPALLSGGVTTARDCGGEFQFLLAVRHAIDRQRQLGPRLLLAGLIDGDPRAGPGAESTAFGLFTAQTPGEAVQLVDMYADAHFDQIETYTQIQPAVLTAIAGEAHARGLTVDGTCRTGTGLPDLNRELELDVQSGMTPLDAIQSVTLVPARTMHLDADSGTIEPGKRADLLLVQGNPLADISDIRRVTSVATGGCLYDSNALARSIGFHR